MDDSANLDDSGANYVTALHRENDVEDNFMAVDEHQQHYDFLDNETDMHNQVASGGAESSSRNMPIDRIESHLTGGLTNDGA